MQFLKKLTRGTASLAFKVLIILTAVVAAIVLTFNSPKKIEKSLNDSGVYSTFISSALKEVQKSNNQGEGEKGQPTKTGDIPIDNPAIVAAADKAFTPQLLQSTTENVLDGTYAWLQGKVTTPNFTIDFIAAKKTFAQGVGEAAKKQLASLPVCTTAQAKAQGTDIDAFSATCRPKGLDINAEVQKVTNDLATSKDFLGTPYLTAKNLSKDSNGQTVFDRLSNAPKVYKWVNASPLLLAGLAAMAGLITFLLYDSKRRGLRNLAIALAVAGSLLIFVSIFTTQAFHSLNQPNGKLGESIKGSFQPTIIKALNSISDSVEQVYVWFGIAYLVLGVGTLLILHFTKPKKETAASEKGDKGDKKEVSAPPKDEPKPLAKPTPKPIQG